MNQPAATRILIVDDNPIDREMLRRQLRRVDEALELLEAECGDDALARCRETVFDCVFLDYQLPDMDGLDFLAEFDVDSEEQPAIVMMTGQGSESVAVAAMKAGAIDYVIKDEINEAAVARLVHHAIEHVRFKKAQHALRDRELELEAARRIQQQLLPRAAPELPGFDIAGRCDAADATGGDFFDYVTMQYGRMGVVAADVSSHGLGPSLIMASTRRLLRTLATYHHDVGQLISAANTAVCEDTDGQHFVTVFFAAIDYESKSLEYAGAGHQVLVIDESAGHRLLGPTGIPLGVDPVASIPCGERLQLEPGMILLLLTDGLTEARDTQRREFGFPRLTDVVLSHRDESAQAILDAVFAEVRRHCAPQTPHDDVTLVVVKVSDHN